MTDGYLKLRCLSDFLKIPVPEFETARFAPKHARLKKEARAHHTSRACARAIVALPKYNIWASFQIVVDCSENVKIVCFDFVHLDKKIGVTWDTLSCFAAKLWLDREVWKAKLKPLNAKKNWVENGVDET